MGVSTHPGETTLTRFERKRACEIIESAGDRRHHGTTRNRWPIFVDAGREGEGATLPQTSHGVFDQQHRAEQLVVDEATDHVDFSLLDGVARWGRSRGRDEVIERSNLLEEPGDFVFSSHVASHGRDAPGRGEPVRRGLQLLRRTTDEDELSPFAERGRRHPETNAGAPPDDDDFTARERCHRTSPSTRSSTPIRPFEIGNDDLLHPLHG
jgi:hypothetical protein